MWKRIKCNPVKFKTDIVDAELQEEVT